MLPKSGKIDVAKKAKAVDGHQPKLDAKDVASLGEIVATEESDGKKVAATRSKTPEADLGGMIDDVQSQLEDRDVAPADKEPVAQKHKEENRPQSKATAGDVPRREKIVADEESQEKQAATTRSGTEDRGLGGRNVKFEAKKQRQKNRYIAPAEQKRITPPNSPVVAESDVRQGEQAKPTVVAGFDLEQAKERQVRSNTQRGFRRGPKAIVITLRYRRPTSRLNATQKTALRRLERVQDLHLEVLRRQQIVPQATEINAPANAKPDPGH